MQGSDHETGKAILISSLIFFLYYTVWVIGLPFIDDGRLKSLFYSQDTALTVPAVTGMCFIGGLILFTMYHVKPYIP